MRKVIIALSLIGSTMMILDGFNIGDTLTLFMLAGVLPGTDTRLGSSEMLMMYALLIGFILSRLWLFFYRRTTRFIRSQRA